MLYHTSLKLIIVATLALAALAISADVDAVDVDESSRMFKGWLKAGTHWDG